MPYTTSVRIETYRRRARRRRAAAALLERGRFDPVAALRPRRSAPLCRPGDPPRRPGRPATWPAAIAGWNARMRGDMQLATQFGRLYQAAQG